MACVMRNNVMQSYGISGYFELVPSQFKAVLIWTGRNNVSILNILQPMEINIVFAIAPLLVLVHVPGSNPHLWRLALNYLGPNYEEVHLLVL
jgi:hypothetical protein